MDELISRQDVIDAVYNHSDSCGYWVGTAKDMEELLNGLPTAEPEREKGKEKVMIERYTLILKHEAVMDDGEKIQLDPPLCLSHAFDRSIVGIPVVLDEMMYHFTQEVMKRATD